MSDSFLNLTGVRKLPLVRQAEAAECGLACLAMIASYHGYEVDLASLRRRFAISLKGATLASLIDIAANLGLGGRAVRAELHELGDLRMPAILHWGLMHFVVLKHVRGDRVEIHDPALGVRTLRTKEVSEQFTGVALELTPTGQFQRKRERNVLKLFALIKISPETLGALWQTVVLTVLIEAFVIATPFYMQLVIDEAILKGDGDLLGALAIAFGLLLLFNVGASALRSLVTQFIGNVLSFESEARLFNHLLRLPLDWFHKRQIGDTQSRFQSIEPVKQFIAGGAVTAALDGVLSVFVLALMYLYAPVLAWIVLGSVTAYAVLRFATLEISRRVAGDFIIAEAREQTRFLETLRAAQTIKIAAQENEREAMQRNAIAASINAGIRAGNVNIAFSAVRQAIAGATDIVVVYLGARAVMEANLTVGMLTAFMAYKGQFGERITNLVESIISWRLLDVHLERIADIALTPREPRLDGEGYDAEIGGAIEARRIFFRYGPGEPEVLKNLDLSIAPGEFVAIAGPSGCGKSTLLKILIGLYQPYFGEVLIDGRPIGTWSAPAIRRQIGVVMQEDQLLQGSIAENIAGFDEFIDMPLVVEVAKIAQIHDAISAMPMGYQSLVGDMGSTLSGGQKQRVLIARALYRKPKILILDEGTSHLDVDTERAVTAALSTLAITRIVVAHRPETVRAAGRIISIGEASGQASASFGLGVTNAWALRR